MGGLRDKFRDLLKKAVAFNPDNDIQKFITEFICESDAGIDIAPMQENIRNYKNLERTADELGRKKAALESIEQCFQDCEKNRQSVTLYSYLIDRAQIQLSEESLLELRKKEKAKADELLNLQENLRMESDNLNILRQQYEDFRLQLHNDETERRLNEIGKKVSQNEQINKFFSLLNQALLTKSEKIILRLKKLRNKNWLKTDNEGLNDVNWIINVISEKNLYDLDASIITSHLKNKQKEIELAYLVKYSELEDKRQ